jgi:Mn-dependent DtxR family transcriptional regulator
MVRHECWTSTGSGKRVSVALEIIREPERLATLTGPLRLRVLEALREPGSATTVAERLGITRQKANYHVRKLEEQGLVEHVEDRPRAGLTERIVRATARHYLVASSVLGSLEADPGRIADRRSSAHLAATAARTVSEVAELRERARAAGKKLPTFSLETAVRFATPADQAAFAEGLADAVAGLVGRYHSESAEGGRWFRVAVGAHPALRPRRDDGESTPATEDAP